MIIIFNLIPLNAQDKQSPPSITLYGLAHVTTDYLDNGEEGGMNLSSNSSRLGIRAGLEISKNLKAIAQVEQEVQWENGAGNFASRDTYVGLQGSFGTIRLGYFDTALKAIRGKIDLFGDQIGDLRNLTRLRDVQGASYDFDTRFRNGIHYQSPSLWGIIFDIHYATNTDNGVNPPGEGNDAVSGSVAFSKKNLFLSGAGEYKSDTSSYALRFGAAYNFGPWRLAGLVQLAVIKKGSEAESAGVNTLGLGVSYKAADKLVLKGQYYRIDAETEMSNADMLALGVDYFLSKPVQLLLAYARTGNNERVSYTMSAGGHGAQLYPAQPGLTANGLSAGIRFSF